MNKKYRVNTFNFIVALITMALFGMIAVYNIINNYFIAVPIFVSLSLLFAIAAAKEGAVVFLSPSGVLLKSCERCLHSYTWEELQEIGVAGLKVFNRANPKKTGTKYIYFSKSSMTESERFDMCLKWPPKDKIYMKYDYERLCAVQAIWKKELEMYNADDIEI